MGFPVKNTGVGCHFLLQGIFSTQGSNPGIPHCKKTLCRLSHQGSFLQCKAICLQSRRRGFHPWVGNIPLEEEVATHSSILACRIPCREEAGGLQSMGVSESQTRLSDKHFGIVMSNRGQLSQNPASDKCPFRFFFPPVPDTPKSSGSGGGAPESRSGPRDQQF